MNESMETTALAEREKSRAALSSVIAAVGLTAMKLAVGLVTNSLGMLSEALHSALDLLAAGMTLFAVRYASLPPDPEHTYGHGKVENLSALVEALLLLVTCVWIVWEAVDRLLFNPVPVTPSLWAVGVMAVSIVVDFTRARMLKRMAKKHRSQALEADALHFSTDIWSSMVVLLGLGALSIAEALPETSALKPWLEKADSIAALGVAAIVVHVSISLSKRAVSVLLDAADTEVRTKILAALQTLPGIVAVHRLRMRQSGPELFVDVMLSVDSALALDATRSFRREIETLVRSVAEHARISVEFVPDDGGFSDRIAFLRGLAAGYGLIAHDVEVLGLEDAAGERGRNKKLLLELHVEMDADRTLGEAHDQVCRFEERVRDRFPDMVIVTHFAPLSRAEAESPALKLDAGRVQAAADELAGEEPGVSDCHNVLLRYYGGEFFASFHCRMRADTPLAAAYETACRLQTAMLRRLPELSRVTVHMEPAAPDGQGDERSARQRNAARE